MLLFLHHSVFPNCRLTLTANWKPDTFNQAAKTKHVNSWKAFILKSSNLKRARVICLFYGFLQSSKCLFAVLMPSVSSCNVNRHETETKRRLTPQAASTPATGRVLQLTNIDFRCRVDVDAALGFYSCSRWNHNILTSVSG